MAKKKRKRAVKNKALADLIRISNATGRDSALVQGGVPAVLAMQDPVFADAARQFSRTFYRRLLAYHQVDLASNEARAALLAGGLQMALSQRCIRGCETGGC